MLKLASAQAALTAMLAHAAQACVQPLAVALLDAGGHVVLLARQDGAALLRAEIARCKAAGALGLGADTRILAERAAVNPVFFNSVAAATGQLVLSAGGVLLHDAVGTLLGAIGVSGDTADIDEQVAMVGRAAIAGETA
jgi:uncharacterized protein GlcG (DUF336 family)